MKSRDTLMRLKKFQAEEKRRRVAQLQTMIAEFARMTGDLDREIELEEKRANITDPAHFAYPTYARAARVRRDNLQLSLNELRGKLEAAQEEAKEAGDELAKAQNQEARDHAAERMVDVVAERRSATFAGEAFRRA
ncbi:flagellar export protein FliJ [Methylocystis heyeri]|uniref:Flagellar export protein FliJ n=1 Tax=Methylocystis heyeri TaxID=391905 RepID=A0A6B8KC28_9HYPH|nr:flagellar export protein FliJ [Methylocystis heyeri]QGM45964.1 flagellar export protein FliJ [Methylocystis heyeri]